MGWAEHVPCMADSRGSCRLLVGRLDRKRSLGRPWHRWEDDIKIYLQEVELGDVDWVDLVQDRKRWRAFVNA